MKISIITTVYNNKKYLEDCIRSVLGQSYKEIEYIVVDGGSSDGTLEIIEKYKRDIAQFISEKDNGIYDALNKGIKLASGEVIGILHSDDIYAYKDVLKDVMDLFQKQKIDSCYGDLCYVSASDTANIIRYWKAGLFNRNSFGYGWMPPHPSFFVKKNIFLKFGLFDLSYRISSDYELMVRFLYKNSISTAYLPKVLVKMRIGGESNKSIKKILLKMHEDYKIIKKYKLGGCKTLFLKNIRKLPQFLIKM